MEHTSSAQRSIERSQQKHTLTLLSKSNLLPLAVLVNLYIVGAILADTLAQTAMCVIVAIMFGLLFWAIVKIEIHSSPIYANIFMKATGKLHRYKVTGIVNSDMGKKEFEDVLESKGFYMFKVETDENV